MGILKVLLPIFKKEDVPSFTNEILREDEGLRNKVIANPSYRILLENKVKEIFKKYRGVLTGSKLIDSWDRVTSAVGLAAGTVPVLGDIISVAEDVVETIPKALYAIYYGAKTKDLKAIPYWMAAEAASFIPYLGDFIDMSNIYVNRARKATKERVKKEMRKILPSRLELKVT